MGPDVTARFDTIGLDHVGPDRIRISGARGEPPPPTLKVAMTEFGAYRNDLGVALTGLDVEEKAALIDAAFWKACPFGPDEFTSVTTTMTNTAKDDPSTNEEAVAVWRLTLMDPDEHKVGRAVSNAMVELALATIPGFFGVSGGPSGARSYGVYRPGSVPAELVPQHVVMVDGGHHVIESVAPAGNVVDVVPAAGPDAPPPNGPTVRAPLGRVVGARSGDKGGNANLGVFVRSDEAWSWLDTFLTTDRLKELLPETADLEVDHHRLPSLRSVNFVVHGLLQQGVSASTRQDAQAKSLGEWLRARYVQVPEVLL